MKRSIFRSFRKKTCVGFVLPIAFNMPISGNINCVIQKQKIIGTHSYVFVFGFFFCLSWQTSEIYIVTRFDQTCLYLFRWKIFKQTVRSTMCITLYSCWLSFYSMMQNWRINIYQNWATKILRHHVLYNLWKIVRMLSLNICTF